MVWMKVYPPAHLSEDLNEPYDTWLVNDNHLWQKFHNNQDILHELRCQPPAETGSILKLHAMRMALMSASFTDAKPTMLEKENKASPTEFLKIQPTPTFTRLPKTPPSKVQLQKTLQAVDSNCQYSKINLTIQKIKNKKINLTISVTPKPILGMSHKRKFQSCW